ncbi:MAG: cytochrome c [Cyclobacteriaceae bacterium]
MENSKLPTLVILFSLLFIGATNERNSIDILTVNEALEKLGNERPTHFIETTEELIKQGRDLVEIGQTELINGKLSQPVSKYFVCTNCHNSAQEDPDIRFSNPDTRLPYVVQKGIPFLQGSTFWGIVNRESWYNDDYYLKYGENVKAANNSLRQAIQLCAIECAQGRPLEQWEEDAILAYYWSLELKMSDLTLPGEMKTKILETVKTERVDPSLVDEIKKYYMVASPATFDKPLYDKKAGYDEQGDLLIGEQIYENSCRHCHQEGGVSDFLLDYAPHTFRFLKKNMFKENDFSIYQIIRKGTYSSPGAVPYMPHYPIEKMSDRQMEGLRKYILTMADKKNNVIVK